MGAWVLPVTFRPKLVTLIACSTDSSADGSRGTWCSCTGSIRVLTMLVLGPGTGKMRVVYSYMLLYLLKRVMRTWGECVHPGCMGMTVLDVGVGEERVGWHAMIWRETV